ncbi:MAG: FkbM family methyltransferase [Jhaorihella sp.]
MKDDTAEALHTREDGRARVLRSRGLKFPHHRHITTGKIARLLRRDVYEYKESEAALRIVGPDDVVLELGAGIGYMSSLIATKCKPAAIHSFEANPGLIDYIGEVHAANGVTGVTVHNALLAPEAGPPADFFVRENLLASSMIEENAGQIVAVEKVEVRSLPDTLAEIRPTVLVCDIEGAEATLLPGADFTGLRAAIIELHPQWIGQAGVQAVFDTMQRAGLTYFPRASEGKVVAFRGGW